MIHIGIDLGPRGVGALAFNRDDGQVVARSAVQYGLGAEASVQQEFEVEELIEAVKTSLRELSAQLGSLRQRVRTMAVVGAPDSCVFVDEQGQAVLPVILPQDRRATAERSQLRSLVAEDRDTINRLLEHQVITLMWLQAHQQEQAERVHQVIDAVDVVLLYLRGLSLADFPRDQRPAMEPTTMTPLASLLASMPRAGLCFGLRDRPKANGILCPSVAQSLGLPFEVSLGFGGHRAAALASAHRVIDEGQLLIHLGDDAELIAASCTPPTFALSTWESCALTEASCHLLTRRLPALGRALDWYLANLCDGEQLAAQMRGCRASEIVAETASTTDVGSGGLDFVFTSGSDFSGGTWHAQWLGVGPHTTKRELSRAVLEGLSLALATELEVAPPPRDEISQVTVSGRHSKNTAWCDILAHVLGCEVQRTSSSQDAAFGAALLAASFDPSAPTLRALCDAFVHPIRRSSPDAIAHARYADMRIRQQTIRAALAACS